MDATETNHKPGTADLVETLLGDNREQLLGAIKRHIDFRNLAEKAQRALIAEVEQVQRQIIRRTVAVAGTYDFPCTSIGWTEFKVKDGAIAPKASVPVSAETLEHFLSFKAGMIVFVDPDVFMGEREASEVFPDQGDLMDRAATGGQAEEDLTEALAEKNADLLRAGIRPLDPDMTVEVRDDMVTVDEGVAVPLGDLAEAVATKRGRKPARADRPAG